MIFFQFWEESWLFIYFGQKRKKPGIIAATVHFSAGKINCESDNGVYRSWNLFEFDNWHAIDTWKFCFPEIFIVEIFFEIF